MKIKIYVLSTVLADENGPAMPAVFADEAEVYLIHRLIWRMCNRHPRHRARERA
jgi:hypothetical protein